MTATERAKRSDALYYETVSVNRRVLCDMIANREDDLEDARAENAKLQNDADLLRSMLSQKRLEKQCYMAENAKLRELVSELWVSCPVHDSDCDECQHKGGRTGCELYDRMRELGVDE